MPPNPKNTNRLTLQAAAVTLQAAKSDAPPKLKIVAYTGEPLDLWPFPDPVVINLAGLTPARPSIPILFEHRADLQSIVGKTDEIAIRNNRLEITATIINQDSPTVQKIVELAAAGLEWQASVGVDDLEAETIPTAQKLDANGRTYEGPIYHVKSGRLREVSVALFGADANTQTALAAGNPPMSQPRSPETDAPQPADVTTAAAQQPAAGPQSPQLPADHALPAAAEYRAAIAAESQRIADILQAAKEHPEIAARAVREGWSKDRTELEVLRAKRPTPAVHIRDTSPNPSALEAALCLRAGIPENRLLKAYGEKTLEAANTRYKQAGLHAVLYESIQAAGLYARPGIVDNDTIRTAFEADRTIRAASAYSTVSLAVVLQNVAARALLNAYEAVAAVAPVIALESDVADFKKAERYRLTGLDTFDKVPPGGELKTASLSDATFTAQADTYGAVLTLDRRMIINDDLGAFLQLPRIMGRKAALQREQAVFELLLSNPNSFFSAANANLITGTDTALSIAALTKAEQTMADQTDANGNPILITPAILLVPTTLKVTAQQLMTETRVNETTATGKPAPANNPHAGKWQPVSSPYLNAAGLPGGSATAWYLLANPLDVAAIEIVYVQGRRAPVIETGEPNFNTLGLSFRAYWDFGVSLQDPKAAVKATGA